MSFSREMRPAKRRRPDARSSVALVDTTGKPWWFVVLRIWRSRSGVTASLTQTRLALMIDLALRTPCSSGEIAWKVEWSIGTPVRSMWMS